MLAMVAVGVWSAMASGRRMWVAPAAFIAAMLAGAVLGHLGVGLPMVETGIAVSILALGLLILGRVELPTAAGVALVAAFALCHGHAHGIEASGEIASYMAGFAATTAALHLVGIAFGRVIAGSGHGSRAVGGVIAVAGAYLVASL